MIPAPYDRRHASRLGSRCALVAALSVLLASCAHLHKRPQRPPEFYAPPLQHYAASNVDWTSLQRVLLMPLDNETQHPQIAKQMHAALAAELQRSGRFEVVIAPADRFASHVREVFATGRFDELDLHKIARAFQTEGILYGQITQYQPYPPLRIGMSLTMIGPAQGVVIASADGLWDAREKAVEEQAVSYHTRTLSFPESLRGKSRVLESPEAFQRFVASQLARSLSSVPAPNGPRTARKDDEDWLPKSGRGSTSKPSDKRPANTPRSEDVESPSARPQPPDNMTPPNPLNGFGVRFQEPERPLAQPTRPAPPLRPLPPRPTPQLARTPSPPLRPFTPPRAALAARHTVPEPRSPADRVRFADYNEPVAAPADPDVPRYGHLPDFAPPPGEFESSMDEATAEPEDDVESPLEEPGEWQIDGEEKPLHAPEWHWPERSPEPFPVPVPLDATDDETDTYDDVEQFGDTPPSPTFTLDQLGIHGTDRQPLSRERLRR